MLYYLYSHFMLYLNVITQYGAQKYLTVSKKILLIINVSNYFQNLKNDSHF